jgi:hypothetical protein
LMVLYMYQHGSYASHAPPLYHPRAMNKYKG